MTTEPTAKEWTIKEQFINDPYSGLTFQFETEDGGNAPYRLRVRGYERHLNRDILFSADGGCVSLEDGER